MPTDASDDEPIYFTARHLRKALNDLDDALLDLPVVLVHGKDLHKPNLVQGWVPAPTPVDRQTVEKKNASLLTIASIMDTKSS